MSGYWEELERPGPDSFVTAMGLELRAGSRVRLHPRAGGDILDLALAGREAVIEAIEQDLDGEVTLAVVVEDDPGRDLGFARQPGHRFFFSPAEVEPVEPAGADSIGSSAGAELPVAHKRILVAGIGNVFLADDGFGVALADRLARRELPAGVEVVDYGIRGMDLAFAMQDGYDAVVMLDATPRGEPPGTLYVIEAQTDAEPGEGAVLETHGMDPAKVLALIGTLGGAPPRTFVVGCEPQTRMTGEEEEIVAQLSEPVRAALDPAVRLVESLLADIRDVEETHQEEVPRR
jgi:hydrogenase maturation protease